MAENDDVRNGMSEENRGDGDGINDARKMHVAYSGSRRRYARDHRAAVVKTSGSG